MSGAEVSAAPAAPDSRTVASMVRTLLQGGGPKFAAECVHIAEALESLSTRCTALEEWNGVLSRKVDIVDEENGDLVYRIAEHNKRCERECETNCARIPPGSKCQDCPRRYMIEVPK